MNIAVIKRQENLLSHGEAAFFVFLAVRLLKHIKSTGRMLGNVRAKKLLAAVYQNKPGLLWKKLRK